MLQLTPPESGETIAILHTNMGDITLRFFPEETPKAYENFITHAKNGYYDGTIFHRVIEGFMIQGGDPEGTGRGGESIWGGKFGQEFDPGLRHFRGAVAMAQSALPNSIGSQFYIVQSKEINPDFRNMYEKFLDEERENFPAPVLEKYLNEGGTPFLDFVHNPNGHTVFGHVIEGMDVVDEIAAVETAHGDRPYENITIKNITVKEGDGYA
jgi:peptidyl-prolyl cis-trans isomerase B (cyclophilin B)